MGRGEVEFYVVVCTDFHHSFGPFVGLELATKAARKMTEEGDCMYVPVGMTPMEDQIKAIFGFNAERPESTKQGRGYL